MQAGCAHQVVDSKLIDLVLKKEDVCHVHVMNYVLHRWLVHFRVVDCIRVV